MSRSPSNIGFARPTLSVTNPKCRNRQLAFLAHRRPKTTVDGGPCRKVVVKSALGS